jgi:predicted amidohydrolase YtcJ
VARKQARKRPGSEKQSPGTIEADLILHSGRIYKVDARRGWAEALAVKDGKIIAVGTNNVVQRFRGNNTKLAELDGRMAMPGLVDVHNHHTRGGQLDLFEVSFPASLSFDQILERVRERAGKMAPGEWLSGGIWSSELVSRLGQ